MQHSLQGIDLDFQELKHLVENPMSRLRGINALVWLAVVVVGPSQKAAAESWNQPIPEPTTESTPQTIQLADQLNTVEAKFYGAHWCPACKKQMRLFGKEAGNKLNYVECGQPEQYPKQINQCRDENIRSIPTWTRPGATRLEGVQSIDALERWSRTQP